MTNFRCKNLVYHLHPLLSAVQPPPGRAKQPPFLCQGGRFKRGNAPNRFATEFHQLIRFVRCRISNGVRPDVQAQIILLFSMLTFSPKCFIFVLQIDLCRFTLRVQIKDFSIRRFIRPHSVCAKRLLWKSFCFSLAFFLLFALCAGFLFPPPFAFVLFFINFGYEFSFQAPFRSAAVYPLFVYTSFFFVIFFFILSNITIKKNIFVSFTLLNSIYAPPSSFSLSLSNYQKPAKPFSLSHPFTVSISVVPFPYGYALVCFSFYTLSLLRLLLPTAVFAASVCAFILPAVWLFRFAANLPLRLCKTSSLPL